MHPSGRRVVASGHAKANIFLLHSLTIFCLPSWSLVLSLLSHSVIIPLYPPGLIKYWCPRPLVGASCLPLAFAIFFIQTVSTCIIHEIKIWSSSNSDHLCSTSCMEFFFIFFREPGDQMFSSGFWEFDRRRSYTPTHSLILFRLNLTVFRQKTTWIEMKRFSTLQLELLGTRPLYSVIQFAEYII